MSPGSPSHSGRWLQPSCPALRNTNVQQIRLPSPESSVSFHLDRYPCLPASEGALSWQPKPDQEETPAEALLPALALPVCLPWCGGRARADHSTVAVLSDSVMRKM